MESEEPLKLLKFLVAISRRRGLSNLVPYNSTQQPTQCTLLKSLRKRQNDEEVAKNHSRLNGIAEEERKMLKNTDWEIIRWRLNESSGVHTLEIEDGTMIHMLAERRYPLSRELMIRMLDHGMEVEDESETAITLIHLFIFLCHCLSTSSLIPRSLNLFLVCLCRLCHLAILCLDQHAHTLHHLESLLTISLDRLDILKEDLLEHEHVVDSKNLLDRVSSSKRRINIDPGIKLSRVKKIGRRSEMSDINEDDPHPIVTIPLLPDFGGVKDGIRAKIMPPRRFKKKSVRKIVEKRWPKPLQNMKRQELATNNLVDPESNNTGGTVIPEMHGYDKVKFAMCTFEGRALTWWNGNVQTLGLANANQIP
ncbi:hypothetical protein Tco_0189083 [Tanacetum coccineum]